MAARDATVDPPYVRRDAAEPADPVDPAARARSRSPRRAGSRPRIPPLHRANSHVSDGSDELATALGDALDAPVEDEEEEEVVPRRPRLSAEYAQVHMYGDFYSTIDVREPS